jgi:phage FluMu protein Com
VASISLVPDEGFKGGPEPGRALIDRDALRCSFCGKVYAEVETMVCGPTPSVAICNECVELVTEIMHEERGGPTRAA